MRVGMVSERGGCELCSFPATAPAESQLEELYHQQRRRQILYRPLAQAKANFYNFYNRLSAGGTAQPQPLRAVADHHQLKG